MASYFVLLVSLAMACSIVLGDNASVQDFCVADTNSSVRVNGWTCMDPKLVDADDFFYKANLHIKADTSNVFGVRETQVHVFELPGLNTLGVTMGRVDFAPGGVFPPHVNPRASEIFTVLEGTIEVGFITSSPENRLITKVLQKGDVWVFPQGLVHYQRNIGYTNAVSIQGYNSQSPGLTVIPYAVFGSFPLIPSDLLAKAFQVDEKIIKNLQSKPKF